MLTRGIVACVACNLHAAPVSLIFSPLYVVKKAQQSPEFIMRARGVCSRNLSQLNITRRYKIPGRHTKHEFSKKANTATVAF